MAETGQKISALQAASSAADADVLAGVQSNVTKKFSFSVILNYIKSKLTPADIGAVPNTRTVNSKALSADIALTAADVGAATTADIPAAYTSTPKMDGTASAGSSMAWARGDHVHPSDATKANEADTATAPWYGGIDLTLKFESEIAASPYSGNPWAWIKARIQAGDFSGIHVNDYIPFTTTNNTTLKACVGGINTYKDYGDTAVGNHIDFVCRELWPTRKPVNPVNYNNGLIPVETLTGDGETTEFVLTKKMDGIDSVTQGGEGLTGYSYDVSTFTLTFAEAPAAGTITVTGTGTEYPWLASDLYLWLNSLAGQVPNGTGLNPAVVHKDYTQGGVYYYLPDALKAVIVEKRAYLPKRYSASGLLSDDNAGGWENMGKLWLPSEFEVYGAPVWGGKGGYATMGNCVQYPIFAHNMNRVKKRGENRDHWWVLSVHSGNTTNWCHVYITGYASSYLASNTARAVPVCFRIS